VARENRGTVGELKALSSTGDPGQRCEDYEREKHQQFLLGVQDLYQMT
jgi:hypothetical protein